MPEANTFCTNSLFPPGIQPPDESLSIVRLPEGLEITLMNKKEGQWYLYRMNFINTLSEGALIVSVNIDAINPLGFSNPGGLGWEKIKLKI